MALRCVWGGELLWWWWVGGWGGVGKRVIWGAVCMMQSEKFCNDLFQCFAVSLPVVVVQLAAALALGADGVNMGTRFMVRFGNFHEQSVPSLRVQSSRMYRKM